MGVIRENQQNIGNIGEKERSRSGSERAQILARHIMSTHITTTSPETSVRDVAKLLCKKKISAVPVMKGHELVGIVSEGDLIQREEIGTATSLAGFPARLGINADYDKSHGLYAKDVMSSNVATVLDTSPLTEIVETMQNRGVKRIPVMAEDTLLGGDTLVGIVSRSDIVRALASRPEGAGEPIQADDDIIRFKVIDTLLSIPGTSPWLTDVEVKEGVVTLTGTAEDETSVEPSRQAVNEIEHVKQVKDRRIILQPY
ncbi:CBS domain-containing protein [Pseudohalocynthiibacter aestuariivivens]|uniref:CBS domain-containing protein n=1 Tax=Pseudohalocynthiibacter aestuariivivens TaxID=1591409 RepID=A0ABV5JKW1_9RHOB|nr:CBS domain-containing protein [Pseudohalocynthiibacter aestuariivivens]MBS9716749.1 CBS domain-containing protein [Pseudohalocynthiibacter aestuariivivens]